MMGFVALMIVLNALMGTLLPILISQGINTLAEAAVTLKTTRWLVAAILVLTGVVG